MSSMLAGGNMLPFDPRAVSENVPADLQKLRQWVLWRSVARDGKTTKVPVDCWGEPAKVSDRATWASFGDVLQAYNAERHSGIGFVFCSGCGFAGADFDACRNPITGQVADWAMLWVKRLGYYCEVSPSGTGLKCFFPCSREFKGFNIKLQFPPESCGKTPGVEAYADRRYFCVTGVRYVVA